jgi:hypothetical protein
MRSCAIAFSINQESRKQEDWCTCECQRHSWISGWQIRYRKGFSSSLSGLGDIVIGTARQVAGLCQKLCGLDIILGYDLQF